MMLIYETWTARNKKGERFIWRGWFLFGILPLILWRRDLDISAPE